MKTKATIWRMAAGLGLWVSLAMGGTFGRVVPIGGHVADLALDEARGVLYIANFTANRIEVMSLADGAIQTSMNIAAQPASMALSRDGRYLVVGHFANFTSANPPGNALTVIDLETRGRQTFALGFPALGVAFGIDNRALVMTTNNLLLFDPVSGVTQTLRTIAEVANELPVAAPDFPPTITGGAMSASSDGRWIFALSDSFVFSYDVERRVFRGGAYTSEPLQAPRTVSAGKDGALWIAGWVLRDPSFTNLAQFPGTGGTLSVGSHALDSDRGLVYAQVSPVEDLPPQVVNCGQAGAATVCVAVPIAPGAPASEVEPPVLQVLDADNLNVRKRIRLRENLAGKSVLSSDGSVMYAASDSGVTILPVGQLDRAPQAEATVEDLIFRGNFCDRRVATQEIAIVSPGGVPTDFRLSSSQPGLTFSPDSGTTPATIRVSIDPNAFQNKGTTTALINIASNAAVNIAKPIRVLINNREPDQRGTIVNVPGTLVDLVADPVRDRFYILRQDTQEVLVYDGTNYNLLARLRTGATPWSMTITFDRRYLLVGNLNSQIVNMYDLETLEKLPPIRTPGYYPRSVAASGKAILAAAKNAAGDPVARIVRLDLVTRIGTALPSLGVYENDILEDTVLTASPNGSTIFAAMADGRVMLYNANVDTFTASRKDSELLAGAYAASSFDQYFVGNTVLNASLVPVTRFEASSGISSGFAFLDQTGFRVTAPDAASPGVIQRVDLTSGSGIRPTRMIEAPLLNNVDLNAFTRTVAPLYGRNVIVSMTTSGFVVLPWNYDASVAPPMLQRVVNAADGSSPLATGGLVSIFGSNLSPLNISSQELPLPTALGESCLTVNGVPVPVLFVSPNQINAQVPFSIEGNVTLILRTPGGVSDNFNLVVLPSAPGVFRTTAGALDDVPTVVRQSNSMLATLSNPLHRGDRIVIFVTGLGRTNPAIDAGVPAPGSPLLSTLIPPTVTIGGVELGIEFAGLSPGQVGVYQINAVLPGHVPLGFQQPLVIRQGGSSTTVAVRVVD